MPDNRNPHYGAFNVYGRKDVKADVETTGCIYLEIYDSSEQTWRLNRDDQGNVVCYVDLKQAARDIVRINGTNGLDGFPVLQSSDPNDPHLFDHDERRVDRLGVFVAKDRKRAMVFEQVPLEKLTLEILRLE